MSPLRLPRTLFGGRMRTSTAFLALAFVAVLLLWYGVRPDPETVTEEVVRVTRTVEKKKPAKEEEREPAEVVRPRTTATPTPSVTPKATKTAAPRPPRTATPTPSEATDLLPPPSEEPAEPEASPPPKGGGLFDFQRPDKSEPTTDSPTEPGD
ncbi:MAG: hypothetical protein ACT4QG_22045 [Sporichthyaceae bacterium]